MGTRRCQRHGCENVMCDRYSATYGYICDYCFNELVDCGMQTDIDDFMEVEKPRSCWKQDHYAFFDQEFQLRE